MTRIENRTFDEINVGDSAALTRTITQQDIERFAMVTGDVNPAHLDPAFAAKGMFGRVVAHGMLGGALFSAVLGTQLPGPGAIAVSQSLRFRRPIFIGDTITATAKVTAKVEEKHRVVFDCTATNQNGEVTIAGVAEVVAPVEKIRWEGMLPLEAGGAAVRS